MDIQLVHFPGTRMVGLEHRGATNKIGETWTRLMPIAGPAGLFRPDKRTLSYFQCGDASIPEAEIRSYAGMEYAADAEIPSGLTHVDVAAGDYAMYVHRGSYTGLSEAWKKVVAGAEAATGRAVSSRDSFEIYRNDPSEVAEEDLETEIYLAVD